MAVYVPVNASMKGFVESISSGAAQAAKESSSLFSSIFGDGVSKAGKDSGKRLSEGLSEVEKATRQVADARSRDAEAAAKLVEAEARLEKIQANEHATQSQLLSAQNAVADARDRASAASNKLAGEEKNLATVRDGGASRNGQVVKAEDQLQAARDRVSATSRKVEVAEEKLREARESGDAAKIASAEAGLIRAKSNAANATDNLAAKESKLLAVQEDVKRSNEAMGGSFAGTSEELAETAKQFGIVSGAIVGAATVVGKKLFDIGSSFATMDNSIRIGTGATGAAFEGLKESARSVAAVTPDMVGGIEHVGQVLADLNTRTGYSGETLEGLTKQFINLGRLTGQEVNIEQITGAMNLFGVEAKDAGTVMDDLFRVSQATGLSINDMGQMLKSGGAGLKQFGFSMSDSAALMGIFNKSGIDANKAVMGLSKAFVEIQKKGGNAREEFKKSINQMEGFIKAGDKAAAVDMAGKIFGTRGATQFVEAIESGRMSLTDLMDAAGTTDDSINSLAEETLTWSEHWQLFKQNAALALQPLAKPVFDALGEGLSVVVDLTQKVAGFLRDNKEVLYAVTGAVAGLAGEVLIFKGYQVAKSLVATVNAAGGLAKAIKGAAFAQKLFNTAAKSNPIGLVVSLVVPVVAALGTFIAKNDEARTVFSSVWDNIKSIFENVAHVFAVVKDDVVYNFRVLGDVFQSIWDATLAPLFDALAGAARNLKPVFRAVAESLKSFFTPVLEVLRAPIHKLGELLAKIPAKIGPFRVPGATLINQWGQQLQQFSTGGQITPAHQGRVLRGGTPGQDSILLTDYSGIPTAIGMPGEMVMTVEATRRNTPLLEAMNRGWSPTARDMRALFPDLARFEDGGVIRGKRTNDEMRAFYEGRAPGESAPSLQGQPYNSGTPWYDCSWTVSAGARYMVGLAPALTRGFATGTEERALNQYGFQMGMGLPGTFRIGWFNDPSAPGGGHTAATLPDGTNIEMRGGDGGLIGHGAIGYDDAMFTHHAFIWPRESAGVPSSNDVEAKNYVDASDGDNGAAPDSVAQQLPPGTFNPGVFSESETAGAGTWSDLIGGAAADIVKTTVSGHVADILGVFGISDQLPPVMQAAVEAAGYVSSQRKKAADEQEKKDKKNSEAAAKGLTSQEQADQLMSLSHDYDPSRMSEQWSDMYKMAIDYTSTTIDGVGRMIQQSDLVSKGNPRFEAKRPLPPVEYDAKGNPKKQKAWGPREDSRIGLFGLTIAQFESNKDSKLGTDIFNPVANAVAALKYATKYASTPDRVWPTAEFFYHGGKVSGEKGRDKIPAYLTDGEFVLNADSARQAPELVAAMNSNPQYASDLEMQVRNTAASTVKNAGAKLPELGATIGQTGTHLAYNAGRSALKMGKNAGRLASSFIPYFGDVIGESINTVADTGEMALDMTEDTAAELAGMVGGEVGAAGSRMINAGVDTLNGNIPTLSSLTGVDIPLPSSSGFQVPAPVTAQSGGTITTRSSSAGGVESDRPVVNLTQNFYANDMAELRSIARREEARMSAGVGPLHSLRV